MFSSRWITKSTGTYSDNKNRLREEIKTADAIVIGAGAGLSTSAGLNYSGERFEKNFADFREKYKSGCFIRRAITDFGNARKPATIKPMTMRSLYGRWLQSKRI